ncbi:hypothetical protein V3C99_002329 [Haemonchus contortus]
MPNTELPRAYAHPASSSSSSSSTSSESSESSSDRRRRRKQTSSSSTTPDYNKAARQRLLAKRSCRKRRQSNGHYQTELRSTCKSKRRHVDPPKAKIKSSSSTSSSSSSSSSSGSNRSDLPRKAPLRSKPSTQRPVAAVHGQSDKGERFYSPKPVCGQSDRPTFNCKCGERYGSRKALIHHTIQNHEADVPCFACNQAIPSLSELSDHIKSKHEKALIVCVYCKSVFGRANDMTENQWKRLKTHMYGELVYAKLAEMQD